MERWGWGGDRGRVRWMKGRALELWEKGMHSLWGWASNTEMKKMTFGDAIKSSFILNINY